MLRHRLASLSLAILAALTGSAGAQTAALDSAVAGQADRAWPALQALYQDLHSHPEIAFEEVRTAARLAAEMRALGFTVTEGVGKTGLVAIYENGAGPTVMVRTELDALPMEEKTGLPYASRARTMSNGRETFVAHSCGHDVHMAAWVGREPVVREHGVRGVVLAKVIKQVNPHTLSFKSASGLRDFVPSDLGECLSGDI